MGTPTTETKRINQLGPMGYSALRQQDDLADELYDEHTRLDKGMTFIVMGVIVMCSSLLCLGFGMGLYYVTQ